MKKIFSIVSCLILACAVLVGCNLNSSKNSKKINENLNKMSKGTYGYDKQFLKKYKDVLELRNGNAAVAIIPDFQGRVMTSSCNGDKGFSFGWINYDLISAEKPVEHINPYGGEERFWIGPEGGQYSIYFEKDKDFVFDNWYVPTSLDTEPFELIFHAKTDVKFQKEIQLVNYSGTSFNLHVERDIKLLSDSQIENLMGINSKGLSMVAYESANTIKNLGTLAWEKETGLLSIWMLGMLIPSPEVTVVIPVNEGDEALFGPKVNDDYFGKVSSDRLKEVGNKIYFKADGKDRGKIGIPPLRATRYMASYDAQNTALTIVECVLPENNTEFVNSAWEIQEKPYGGDALNSYNDGPLENGSQMGPFYELETSSPALALEPQQSYTHRQRTFHFVGSKDLLDRVTQKVLKVSIEEIEAIF